MLYILFSSSSVLYLGCLEDQIATLIFLQTRSVWLPKCQPFFYYSQTGGTKTLAQERKLEQVMSFEHGNSSELSAQLSTVTPPNRSSLKADLELSNCRQGWHLGTQTDQVWQSGLPKPSDYRAAMSMRTDQGTCHGVTPVQVPGSFPADYDVLEATVPSLYCMLWQMQLPSPQIRHHKMRFGVGVWVEWEGLGWGGCRAATLL